MSTGAICNFFNKIYDVPSQLGALSRMNAFMSATPSGEVGVTNAATVAVACVH